MYSGVFLNLLVNENSIINFRNIIYCKNVSLVSLVPEHFAPKQNNVSPFHNFTEGNSVDKILDSQSPCFLF